MRQGVLRSLLCVFSVVQILSAGGFTVNGINYWQTAEGEVEVSRYYTNNPYTGDIVIPQKIEVGDKEYFVTSIGKRAFAGCDNLQSVSIPYSIKTIGSAAFQGCSLTSIVIPNSVTSIGDMAFSHCSGLAYIDLPDSITTIRSYTFQKCVSLTTIVIPDNVEYIEGYSFSLCDNLCSIQISDKLKSIGEYAFWNCCKLQSIIIPANISYIHYNAFSGCDNMEKVVFHCKEIGAWFKGLKSIKEVVIGNEVISIGESAFSGCCNLYGLNIPNSVQSIKSRAFMGCTALVNISISESVTVIEDATFRDCKSIEKVTIPNNVNIIKNSAFEGCEKLKKIRFPQALTTIESSAFSGCVGLDSLMLPNNITTISDNAFSGCNGIESVTLDCQNIGRWFKDNSSVKEVLFGDNVKTIGENAFENCIGVTSLTIPIGISSIGAAAFKGCSGLKEINYLAETCATQTTGESPFCNLSSIERIYVGDEVKVVPAYFTRGLELISLSFGNNLTEIGDFAFRDMKVKDVYISDITNWCNVKFTNKAASPLQFAENLYIDGLLTNNLNLTNGISSISDYAFYGFKGYVSLTIPASVIDIGKETFADSDALTQLFFNAKECTSLKGKESFHSMSLENAVIGNEVVVIPDYFLYSCKNLKTVSIGEQVSHVGDYAFSYCDSLSEIVLPNTVKTIGEACFMYSGVNNVVLSEKLTTIPKWTFKGCHLGAIILPQNIQSLGEESFASYGYGTEAANSVSILYIKNPNRISADKAFNYDKKWYNEYSIPCTAYVPRGSLEIYKKYWPWAWFRGLYEWDVPTDNSEDIDKTGARALLNDASQLYSRLYELCYGEAYTEYQTRYNLVLENAKVRYNNFLEKWSKATSLLENTSLPEEKQDSIYRILKNALYEGDNAVEEQDKDRNHLESYNQYREKAKSEIGGYKHRLDSCATAIETVSTLEDINRMNELLTADIANMKQHIEDLDLAYIQFVNASYVYETKATLERLLKQMDDLINELTDIQTGISTLTVTRPHRIFTIQGVPVEQDGMKRLPRGIYVIDGKKVVVR